MNEEKNHNITTFQIDEPVLLDSETETISENRPRPRNSSSSKNKKKKRRKPGTKSSIERNGKGTPSKNGKRRKKRKKSDMHSVYIHLIFIALILLIAIVGIVKLVKWNEGTESGYDPNDLSTEFDTEPEDFFVPLDSATASLQKDDGITSILLLGNGVLAKTKGDNDSIGMLLEKFTNGKVYDASLNHTYLSVKNTTYDEEYPTDVFSLYWITQCLTLGDFTLLEDTANIWNKDETVHETIDMLKNLDMESVDVITIMYDFHDYEDERRLAGPYDDAMAATACGCLLQSIRLIQQTYPHIRIIVSSPYFCFVEDGDYLQSSSSYNMGHGTLADYMIAYKNIAVNSNVSFIDNYFGTITEDNYEEYLDEDNRYPNEEGRSAIAERIASFIGE